MKDRHGLALPVTVAVRSGTLHAAKSLMDLGDLRLVRAGVMLHRVFANYVDVLHGLTAIALTDASPIQLGGLNA
jgi:hypothetical protein